MKKIRPTVDVEFPTGLAGWVVALLQSIPFFVNVFHVPVHIRFSYDKHQNVSAEPPRVKLTPKEKTGKKPSYV